MGRDGGLGCVCCGEQTSAERGSFRVPSPITAGTGHLPTGDYPFYRHRDRPHLWGMSLNVQLIILGSLPREKAKARNLPSCLQSIIYLLCTQILRPDDPSAAWTLRGWSVRGCTAVPSDNLIT